MRAKIRWGGVIVSLLITLLPLHTALAGMKEYINQGVSWAKGTASYKTITNYTTPAYNYITTSQSANFIAGAYNYARPFLNNYVKPILRSGLNTITLSQPGGASENIPMNQSSFDDIFNFTVDGKNYTGVTLNLPGKYNSTNSTKQQKLKERTIKSFTEVQNGTLITTGPGLQTGKVNLPQNNATRPLAPPNLSAEDTKVTFPFFPTTYTGNPGVDAFKRLGVDANLTIPTQKDIRRTFTSANLEKALGVVTAVPQAVSPIGLNSSVVVPINLTESNPVSLTDKTNRTNLMGPYLNSGRRKDDPTIYNPKYDARIASDPNAVTNQINPASFNDKKGALYYNDGTQYGFRSNKNDAYDISIHPIDPSIAASIEPKNQINYRAVINNEMMLYYNDGTRYGDRKITNHAYDDIPKLNSSLITSQ